MILYKIFYKYFNIIRKYLSDLSSKASIKSKSIDKLVNRLGLNKFQIEIFNVVILYFFILTIFQLLSLVLLDFGIIQSFELIEIERAELFNSVEFLSFVATIFFTFFVFTLEAFRSPNISFEFTKSTKFYRPLIFFLITIVIFSINQFIDFDSLAIDKLIYRSIVIGNLITLIAQIDSIILSLEYKTDDKKYTRLIESARRSVDKLEDMFKFSTSLWEKELVRSKKYSELESKVKIFSKENAISMDFGKYLFSETNLIRLNITLNDEEIVDINLDELKIFFQELDKVFEDSNLNLNLFNSFDFEESEKLKEIKQQSFKAQIGISFSPVIPYKDTVDILTIAQVNSDATSNKIEITDPTEKKIHSLWEEARRKIFMIEKDQKQEEFFNDELINFASKYQSAISKEIVVEIKEIGKYFVKLLEAFDEFVKNNERDFSNNAMFEFNSFRQDKKWWSLLKIIDVIEDSMHVAFYHNPPVIVESLLALIKEILYKFSKKFNPLLIIHGLNLLKLAFSLNNINRSECIKSDFIPRNFYAPLKEVLEYIIVPKFKDNKITSKDFKFVAQQILLTYQFYLKTSHSNSSIGQFKYFANKLPKFLMYFEKKSDSDEVTLTYKEIIRNKDELIFGFLTWLQKNHEGNIQYIEVLIPLLPDKLDELFTLYLRVLQKGSSIWGWEYWHDDSDMYDLTVRSLDFKNEMADVFIKKALLINISGSLKPTKSILYIYNILMPKLTDLINNDNKKAESLLALLDKAKEEQEKKEEEEVKEKIINEVIKKKFITKLVAEINRRDRNFRKFFKEVLKTYDESMLNQNISEFPEELFGINQIIPKDAFTKEGDVSYEGLMETFANGLERFENAFVWKKLDEELEEILNWEDFKDKINSQEYILITDKYNFWEIGEKYGIEMGDQSDQDPFTSHFRVDTKKIYQLWGSNNKDKQVLIALPKENLPKFIQLPPKFESTQDSDIYGYLQIKLDFYSQNNEELDKILGSPPDWLEKIGDRKQQSEYLKTKGVIKIFENLKIDFPSHGVKGFKFYFVDED